MMPRPSIAAREQSAAVWAPWIAAPLFALLPIGGCGLAGGLRPGATTAHAVPVAAEGADAPVVTVVTAGVRQVALGPAAH